MSVPEINGKPAALISVSAQELVPTQPYGNVTIGPVRIERYVADGTEEELSAEIQKLQELAELRIGQSRNLVYESIRAAQGQGRTP